MLIRLLNEDLRAVCIVRLTGIEPGSPDSLERAYLKFLGQIDQKGMDVFSYEVSKGVSIDVIDLDDFPNNKITGRVDRGAIVLPDMPQTIYWTRIEKEYGKSTISPANMRAYRRWIANLQREELSKKSSSSAAE